VSWLTEVWGYPLTTLYPPNRAEAEGERPAQNWRPERPEAGG